MIIGVDGRSLEEERTGIGRYLSNLLSEWAQEPQGHTFHLYFLSREPQDDFLDFPPIKKIRLAIEAPFEKAPFYPELERAPVDVFFSPLYDLPRCLNIPAAIAVHDMVYEAYPESFTTLQLEYLRSTSAFSIPYASRIITDSDFAYREIIKHFPEAGEKIAVIPLACDPVFHRTPIGRDRLRKYPLTGPYFFFLGSISKKRHIPELVEAFSRFMTSHPDFQLLLVGRNLLLEGLTLSEMIERCAPGGIVYLPYVPEEDLPVLYREATAFVYLSEYEGFGMPPLEAMACGTPVITTGLSSLPEVVGEAALIVDPRDLQAIEGSLAALADDEATRRHLIEKGRDQLALFSWKKTAAETLRVIKDAALDNPHH
jgi:glycosyltransferase involved in cell wall biosynthesis